VLNIVQDEQPIRLNTPIRCLSKTATPLHRSRTIHVATRAALLAGIVVLPHAALGATWTVEDWRPTITSDDGQFSMSVRARLQVDTGSFDQEDDVTTVTPDRDVEFKHLKSRSITRRLYLGVEGRAFGNFWYEYRMDFGGTDLAISNPIINLARISYNVGDMTDPAQSHFRINAGLIKPMFTYDDSTSSAALTFLERADVVNVATSSYGGGIPRLGAELAFQQADLFRRGDNLVISGAFTGQNAGGKNGALPADSSHEGDQVLGRIVYRLWSDGVSSFHIGGSGSHLLRVGESNTVRGLHAVTLQDLPEIRVDGSRLVSTGPIAAKSGSLWGLESVANFRSVYFQGEYYHFNIERALHCLACVAAANPDFSGWYVQASWILTGETKAYQPIVMNNNMATFASPRVSEPVSLDGKHWGVWEIAARYSDLDLNWNEGLPGTSCTGPLTGCVRGGEEKIVTLGLNWYLSNNVRLMFDYLHVDVNKLNASGQQIGQTFNVFGTRLQLTN
jgi:phosphate-selective porin OprO/OprP